VRTVAAPIAVLLAAEMLTAPARADIYTWVDESGTVHYSEEPPPAGKRSKKVRLPQEEEPQPEPEEAKADKPRDEGRPALPRTPQPQPPAARPKLAQSVELFATSWCPSCRKAREYFQRKGISFVEYDIEKDKAARQRKIDMDGNTAIPTVVIGGKIIRGYQPAEYDKALQQ
jgi:glutaredoxin-like YruB-family protein